MIPQPVARQEGHRKSALDGFRESVPLIATAGVFFAAGVYAWIRGLTFGRAHYVLADLLIGLGFIAGIGATLSWFFAGEPSDQQDEKSSRTLEGRTSESYRPEGRPRPDVRIDPISSPRVKSQELPPWDEGPVEPPRHRPSIHSAKFAQAELQQSLQELEGLQQELTTRRVRNPESRR